MAETTPAGWFTDPTGRHDYRYWDGSTWTDHVASGGVVATDAVDPAPAAPVAKRARARAIGVAGAAFALLAIMGVGAVAVRASSGGSDPSAGSRPAHSHVTLDTCYNGTSIVDDSHGAVAGGRLSIDAPGGGTRGFGTDHWAVVYDVKIGFFQAGKLIDEETAHAKLVPGLTSGAFSAIRPKIKGEFTCKVLDVHQAH